jgi:hypothetical protein
VTGVTLNPDEQSKNLLQVENLQAAMKDLSTGISLLNGLQAGGIGGAMQAGSAMSSIASSLNMTPMGQAIATGVATIAGFIGIGPHETAQQTPDKSDPFYRQWMPDWAGTQQDMGGKMVQPGSKYSKYAGAANEAQQMYNFVSNPSSQIGMNPDQVSAIQQMQALSKNKAGVDMGAAGLAVKSEHNGVLTFASGQTMPVDKMDELVQITQGLLESFNNNILQQQQNADRLASSFTALVLNGPANFKMPEFVGGGSGQGFSHRMPSPFGGRNSSNVIVATMQTLAPNVTVHILQGATINEASQKSVEAAIKNSIPEITDAVNSRNYSSTRSSGSYVSSTW